MALWDAESRSDNVPYRAMFREDCIAEYAYAIIGIGGHSI